MIAEITENWAIQDQDIEDSGTNDRSKAFLKEGWRDLVSETPAREKPSRLR